jgi:chromosome segregation protein
VLSDQENVSKEERAAYERLDEVRQEVAELQSDHEEAQRQHTEAQARWQAKQGERTAFEEKLQNARAYIEQWNAQRAESQARLDELGSRFGNLNIRLEQADKAVETARLAVGQAEEKLSLAQQRRAAAEENLRQADAELERAKQEVERLEQKRRAKLDERAERLTAHTRLITQIEVLEQAEHSLAGYAEGARFLLNAARESRLRGAHGALSAVLDVPAELEVAISAALGDSLDAILLDADEVDVALKLLESDEAGRAVLLPLRDGNRSSLPVPIGDPYLGVASELVSAPEHLRPAVHLMLGQTIVVRDRDSARRLAQELPGQARVVTLRGEVFRADGLVIAGKTVSSAALGRPRRKRELAESLSSLEEQIGSLNAEMETISSQITAAQGQLARADRSARQARLNLEETEESAQGASLEFETARRQLEWQDGQKSQLQMEIAQAAADRQSLRQSLSEVEAESVRALEEVRTFSAQIDQMNLGDEREKVTYWKTRLAVVERALQDARAKQEERRSDVERFDTRRSEFSSRLQETETTLASLEEAQSGLREHEGALRSQLEALRIQIDPAEKNLETSEEEERRLQGVETEAQDVLSNSERLFNQLQLDQVRKQEALEHLRQRVVDDFGLVMFDDTADTSEPAALPSEEMVEELPVVTEISPDLEARLTQQRSRLRRSGPINPEAKQEFEQESERYSFMSTQVEDLRKAEEDLRKVIAELDELTQQEFSKTFDAVDKQFRAMFTRLFGGGSARLALTDPDNLVETGIEIEARLPGRREQGLALLSGGERSLTAVALVFALLKVSPTPVCVMDEVDAMLDEANVGRFRDLLLELSQDTQFIIITHNRNTVQAADVIYGITMGRDSTSQVISLRLDQITNEMLQLG